MNAEERLRKMLKENPELREEFSETELLLWEQVEVEKDV